MKKINLENINLSGGTPSGGGASDASLAALEQKIEEMEYVTATALADLYSKIGAATEALSQI